MTRLLRCKRCYTFINRFLTDIVDNHFHLFQYQLADQDMLYYLINLSMLAEVIFHIFVQLIALDSLSIIKIKKLIKTKEIINISIIINNNN